jgi:hypothetical protein
MLAIGSVLAGVGVLLVALLALLLRHPRAPRWTALELGAMLMSVPLTVLIGFGLGYALTGGYWLLHGTGNVVELFAPVGVAAVVVPLLLPIRRRLKAYAGTTSGLVLVSSQPESGPPIDEPPRRPTRRAA